MAGLMPVRTLAIHPPRKRRQLRTDRAEQKRATHERILKSGGAIARREGLRAASVPRVMSGAGLTVGGFYAHFASKVAMDVEIVRSMLGVLPGRWLSGLEDSSGFVWVKRALSRYLNVAHRDNPAGCPYPAVLSEIAAAPVEVRQAFAEAFEPRVKAFEAHVPAVDGCTARERALATMALTIGGVLLARATRGTAMSDEMLDACKKWALPEANAGSSGKSSTQK